MEIPGITNLSISDIPFEVYQLAGVLVFALVAYLGYVYYIHRVNRGTALHFFTIVFPSVKDEDVPKYRKTMETIFAAAHRFIYSQTDKLFIEILKAEDYISIQLGSNSISTLEKVKRIFSQIENIEIQDSNDDKLKQIKRFTGKNISSAKSYYPITLNGSFCTSIFHYLASLKDDEQGGIQFILRGVNKKEAIKNQITVIEGRSQKYKRRPTDSENYETTQYQSKLQGNLFKVKINAVGNSSSVADGIVSLVQTLNHDTNVFSSATEKTEDILSRYIAPETILTSVFRKSQGSYLTAAELAFMVHPVAIERGTYSSKQTMGLEAPPEYLEEENNNIQIGSVENGAAAQPVYFPISNLQRHIYVVGKTGRGKSTFLTGLISGLINKRAGSIFVFDPHGELLVDIMNNCNNPDDVVYLNIENQDSVFTFNPLFAFEKSTYEKASIRDALLEIIQNETSDVAGQTSGVATYQRIKQVLEMAIDFPDAYYTWLLSKGVEDTRARELVFSKQITLNDLPLVLLKEFGYIQLFKALYKDQTSPTALYVNKLLDKHINNQMVVEAVQTRLEQLLHPSIRLICEGNKLNLAEMVTENKAFLIPISETVFGAKGERALLQSILSMLWLEKRKGNAKNDTYVFIDECQRAQISAIPRIIAEARKYRLFLGLSNQQLGQLREEVKTAILGNMGTLVSFTVAADDTGAKKLAPFFGGQITEEDLANLPKYKAYLRTEGTAAKPQVTFSFKTIGNEVQEGKQLGDLQARYRESSAKIEDRLKEKFTNPLSYFLDSIKAIF